MSTPTLVAAADPVLASSTRLADARAAILAVEGVGYRSTRESMCALLDTRSDPLVRTERPGHLTGSAFVVDHEARHTLLMLHVKLGIWLQPGGHADGDANLAAVALREASEETGIGGLRIWPRPVDLDIHVVTPPHEDRHEHHDVRYLVVAPPGAVPVKNHESHELRWVAGGELAPLGVDAGLHRLASRGFELARQLIGSP